MKFSRSPRAVSEAGMQTKPEHERSGVVDGVLQHVWDVLAVVVHGREHGDKTSGWGWAHVALGVGYLGQW